MPKITIAIPTYNRKDYLKEAILSVLCQSFKDFEIIVFDNCSNFNIESFVDNFNDSRITFIKNEENLGNFGNFVKIFNHKFKTEYLVVFHDDDVMHPDMLKRHIEVMGCDEKIVFSGTSMNFISDHSKMNIFENKFNSKNIKIKSSDKFVELIMDGFNLCFGSVMYRTCFLYDLSSFSAKFFKWSDRPYLVQLSRKGTVSIVKDTLVNYRLHPNQDSKLNNVKMEDLFYFASNLFYFYKNELQTKKQNKKFKIFTTNNSIGFVLSSVSGFKNRIVLIKQFRKNNLFSFIYLRLRGVKFILKDLSSFFSHKFYD